MTREEILPRLQSALGDKLLGTHVKSPKRLFVEVAPEHIVEVSRLLFKEWGARFQIASGIDQTTSFEILYHWAFDALNCLLTVRVRLDRDHPVIDSLTPVFKASEWIEREMWELLGIQFRNHPGLTHLLLKDDWPEGQYPLRRDYRGAPQAKPGASLQNSTSTADMPGDIPQRSASSSAQAPSESSALRDKAEYPKAADCHE